MNGGEETYVMYIYKKRKQVRKNISPHGKKFEILQWEAKSMASRMNCNYIVLQNSPDMFHVLFYILFVRLLCFLPSQCCNPLRRNLLSALFFLLIPSLYRSFHSTVVQIVTSLVILDEQNCNSQQQSNIKTGAMVLNSRECERPSS